MVTSATPATPAGAVFLSYAREDLDGARRIAEALRSSGVEVWFDLNELRGGDAWDQKIRRQIKECALFLPIISAQTQDRGEGYFRLEWKLAVERSHLMAEGVPFFMPVVIDDTPESAGLVPEQFMRVQWARLPGALPSPQFIEQVQRLLAAPRNVGRSIPAPFGTAQGTRPVERPPQSAKDGMAGFGAQRHGIEGQGDPARPQRKRFPVWVAGALAAVVIGVVAAILIGRKPAVPPAATPDSKLLATHSSLPATVAAAAVATDKSIAVLPFTNMSDDKDTGFFADGVHEDLLTNLAIVPELKVVSRTSVLQYRGTTKTMRQIGGELGVAYLLEGSVRRAGNKVRVTGQLINTGNDEHVWAKSYDRDLTDIFAIQSAIAQEIATALSAVISPEVRKHLERRPTDNPAAYDLFLQGRNLRNNSQTGVLTVLAEAERFFQGAVELDPKFAAAWGELAVVHALFGFWGMDHTPGRIARGEAAMRRAEQLAPEAPDVIRVRGTYAYYAFRDYAAATEAYEKLARLQPNDPTVYSSLGLIARRQGRWSESVSYFQRAVELDPASYGNLRNLAVSLSANRRWDEVRAVRQKIVALRPDDLHEQFLLALNEFEQSGSLRPLQALLAGLPPLVRESPEGIYLGKNIAYYRQDTEEYRRLDRRQPYFFRQENPEVAVLFAGSMYAAAGDPVAARDRVSDTLAQVRRRLLTESASAQLWATAGGLESILGNHEEAFRNFRQAQELVPESRDALDGNMTSVQLAMAQARSGDKERALAELARLLRKPLWNWSVHTIRVDPGFANLRGDPRFEALLNDPKNNAPWF